MPEDTSTIPFFSGVVVVSFNFSLYTDSRVEYMAIRIRQDVNRCIFTYIFRIDGPPTFSANDSSLLTDTISTSYVSSFEQ